MWLIRASFVPPTSIQELRDLTRTRKQLVREQGQHVQRIQKTLEDAPDGLPVDTRRLHRDVRASALGEPVVQREQSPRGRSSRG